MPVPPRRPNQRQLWRRMLLLCALAFAWWGAFWESTHLLGGPGWAFGALAVARYAVPVVCGVGLFVAFAFHAVAPHVP